MEPKPYNDSIILWHRFFAKFAIGDPTECWEWDGAMSEKGYGVIFGPHPHHRSKWRAHRLSFMFFNGPIPDELLVCHRCNNRKCVNPHHLYAGSIQDNNQDAANDGKYPNGCGRLTATDVEKIVKALAQGRTSSLIAMDFKVSTRTVRDIATGKTWKSVTGFSRIC